MGSERWQQIDRLFDLALERGKGEREAFLDQNCTGDGALRHEIESLLKAHDLAQGFLESPALDVAARLIIDRTGGLKAGESIGRYEIRSLLGKGGMSEVYLAHDTALRRSVALKMLPQELADQHERLRRFEQEARNVSALNHPNILTIYEVGRTESLHYIATEFIDGMTLRRVIANRPMDVTELVDTGIQIANALAAAHEAGIVHRDIKPENIMVRRDGYVKVLDFGIAKFTGWQAAAVNSDESAGQSFETATGVVIGTANYMSPEQARGLDVDARTDIWSLGCLLYEMYAGRAPFGGATPGDVLVAILDREPLALEREGKPAPPELERIVLKALRKERLERYQDIRDLAAELKLFKRQFEDNANVLSSLTTRRFSVQGQPELPPETLTQVRPVSDVPAQLQPTGSFFNKKRALFLAPVLGVILVAIGLIVVGTGLVSTKKSETTDELKPPAAVEGPTRTLSYSITVQKYRASEPYQQPFQLASEINFEKDYRIRLNVHSPQEGHLYILNERPASGTTSAAFNVMFPSFTANGGASRLLADQQLQIPSESWFQFDAEEGTELIWLIWTAETEPVLEAVKRFANPKDRGMITDPEQTSAVEEFLRVHSAAKPSVEKDDERRETHLRAKGEILTQVIRLEHH